ncbi:sugar phosphate nucleotidyltransferase [Dactylosporangium sp. CA-139066]|uniref:sugar phosphate nucleotidyltransferase n=1 Tax=Dactylosporangium sp. CA-139066 TaxID=3239930 RepID=UPI003D8E180C
MIEADGGQVAEAVVLVGGQGERLRPLTLSTPKPLLPMAGAPFLVHLLARLRAAGIERVVLATGYRAACFGPSVTGAVPGLSVECIEEPVPLGTGGALRHAVTRLGSERVLVHNGDSLSGADIRALVGAHDRRRADLTICLTDVADVRPYGAVQTDAAGWVTDFREKGAARWRPPGDPATSGQARRPTPGRINAGCYVVRRSLLDAVPAGETVSLERRILPDLLLSGARVLGHPDPGYFRDIGTVTEYIQACRDLVLRRAPTPLPHDGRDGVLRLGTSIVEAGASMGNGTTVGPGCHIGPDVRLDASVLMSGVHVGAGTTVVRSVLGAGSVIEWGAEIVDSVVADGAHVGAGARLAAGARIWPGAAVARAGVVTGRVT